ncbi:unnamed protein product [Darwinula stevensoni]|uniref:ABC transporter domain-containing protein n=1 Tax=Darwinula stevensoni TaxID=69355 RepID=A0A7R8X2R7_9CRUS|nr:unnamed protein product [Darwinula stevensoni]CAG0881515.1 unnamed protein product [Darwinula stevensoni]
MAGVARKFVLLVWKNLLVRWRHPILTGLEVVIPILICVVTFLSYGECNIRTFRDEDDLLAFLELNNVLEGPDFVYVRGAVVFLGNTTDTSFDDEKLRYKIRTGWRISASLFASSFDQYRYKTKYYGDNYLNEFIPIELLVNSAWIRAKQGWGPFSKNLSEPIFREAMVALQQMPSSEDFPDTNIFILAIPLLTVACYLFLIPVQHLSIVRERQSGIKVCTSIKECIEIKELMKMMGMSRSQYWLSHFANGILSVILVSIIAIAYLSFIGCLPHSDKFLIFLLFFLFGLASLGSSCLVTTIFQRLSLTIPFAMFVTAGTSLLPAFSLAINIFPTEHLTLLALSSVAALCLLPNVALVFAFWIVGYFEKSGEGVRWENLFERTDFTSQITMGFFLIMLLADIFIYSVLTGYVDTVRPGKYGLAEPIYFFLKPSFWYPTEKSKSDLGETVRGNSPRRGQYFQEDLRNRKAGIEIVNLRKVYQTSRGGKVAVDGLSLSACEGDITVLLGHNGAGKTTTMSIITGGTALVNGYDIRRSMEKVRDSLGLCPQHCMLFPELTVAEHIFLFGQLRGLTKKESMNVGRRYADRILIPLGSLARNLSGDMKRKLSLIISLIGNTKVVILDEPTTGLDPEDRRIIWDILQEEKRDRTILLTTHYMEEADVLGDRIAIMAHGQLQCVGSSMFLKKHYGSGYTLTVTKTSDFQAGEVLSILQNSCPEAELRGSTGSEESYMLPSSTAQAFPSVLESLEKTKAQLGIRSFSISATTLEEVFLRVGEGADTEGGIKHTPAGLTDIHHASTSRLMGMEDKKRRNSLFVLQFKALLTKKFIHISRKWKLTIVQVIIPLGLVLGAQLAVKAAIPVSNPESFTLAMNVDIYGKNYVPYEVWPGLDEKLMKCFLDGLPGISTPEMTVCARLGAVLSAYPIPVKISEGENFIQYLWGVGTKDWLTYQAQYVIGGSLSRKERLINGTQNFTAFYQTAPLHSSGIAVNHVSDAMAKFILGTEHSILAYNQPLPDSFRGTLDDAISSFQGKTSDRLNEDEQIFSSIAFASMLGLGMSLFASSFALFPAEENESTSKQLQLMTGVRPEWYWVAHLMGDGVVFLVVCALVVGIMGGVDADDIFADSYGSLGSLVCLLLMYGFAALPFTYVFSFGFKNSGAAFTVHALVDVFLGVSLLTVELAFEHDIRTFPGIRKALGSLFPFFGFGHGILNLIQLAYENGRCEAIGNNVRSFLCSTPNITKYADLTVCCDNCMELPNGCFESKRYISLEGLNIGEAIIMLGCSGLFWFVCLFLLEHRHPQRLWGRLFAYSVAHDTETTQVDEDVLREEERIRDLFQKGDTKKDALLAVGLTKSFKRFVAVDRLNIGVHHGECFGLLGVNGAGKTTTFKMLTGEEVITSGGSCILGYSLGVDPRKYLSHLGYCPQFDALVNVMTAKETLLMYARLRGVPESVAEPHVDSLIDKLGLTEYKNKQCGTYSSGSKRKLCTAIAMVGEPTLLLLDEPTLGVDPVSRRKIWEALVDCTDKGQSIVLSSHSMEECEYLCHRLGIMVNGRFRCLGSPQYLKDKYCQGYSIKVKTKMSASAEKLEELKAFLVQTLGGSFLRDEYMGMLNFLVERRDVTWAQLFSIVRDMKTRFEDVVADSLVGETCLEDAFLSFTSG